ncbi:MAG: two-component sensor histidine kinase [Mediterranea sp.]|jgi:two-component system OmpR family sensor kinase|nr:two-component sensor histidine kinase [Mediterranea sp.]
MKHFLSFSLKLFFSITALFLGFTFIFIAYQYKRERDYKVDLLNMQLQDYNNRLYEWVEDEKGKTPHPPSIDTYLLAHPVDNLRMTVIDLQGNVLYESYHSGEAQKMTNHLNRPEVQAALKDGQGFDVRRTSETLGVPYFYSATRYHNRIYRSAQPYNMSLINSLKADPQYLWFTAIVTLLLLSVFYRFTSKLGAAITRLRKFAMRADRDEAIEPEEQEAFPNNELGEISQHIVQIYQRLHDTKDALYIEREKLITHLQTSHEGLGVFTKEKKEILVNSLFTQYSNLLSDANLKTTEEVFGIKELQPITSFINKNIGRYLIGKDEAKKSINLYKNGRFFIVECIIFQDDSFEISINDVTQEEEQASLKRQLTQNVAHELKTPVSSIQGYLETIIHNDDLPTEKLQAFIQRCYAQSNRLSRLLSDISVLTRMDDAPGLIGMELVDITALVEGILADVSLDLEEKQITVVNTLYDHIQIRGNQSLLYSIFRNLMDNAIAYAGTHIRVNISCFREDEHFYYFSFADTGIGVSPEHLNRLFERFYRVDKGRSRKLGGTGLGLAIVKNAVLIHGGSISAKNAPGGGLEFVFTLKKQ